MATLSLTKNYADATLLLADDFDVFLDEVETLLNTTKLNDDNIQTDGITGSDKILTATITTAKIVNSNITTAKIADGAITTAKINNLAVTTAKFSASSISTTNIADSAVTTAKITDLSVTKAKIRAANYAKSAATSGTITTVSTSLVGSATITTGGRPVLVFLESGGGSSAGYLEVQGINTSDFLLDSGGAGSWTNSGFPTDAAITSGIFYRDASIISAQEHRQTAPTKFLRSVTSAGSGDVTVSGGAGGNGYTRMAPGIFAYIDQPTAGTYVYSVYLGHDIAADRYLNWYNLKVVAVEL